MPLPTRSTLLAFGCAWCAWAGAPAAGAAVDAGAAYAQPVQRVDIGGRRLQLHCAGSGSPTVLFEAAAGEAGWDWFAIHEAVSRRTKACVYDRAGLGFSDASPRTGTAEHAVEDLHALLGAARLPPPYVLVGHSYGALVVRLYAQQFRADVKGLVLVDGYHEDEHEQMGRLLGERLPALQAQIADQYGRCTQAAEAGMAAGSDAARECLPPTPRGVGPTLAAARREHLRSPIYWKAARSENDLLSSTSAEQLRAQRAPLGALPLVSLTRGVSPYRVPGQPASGLNVAVEQAHKRLMDQAAAQSTQGVNRVVAGAGHAIHVDRPQAVLKAVDEVLAAARR